MHNNCNIKVVIGLGFGDEGKGLVTDYLSSKDENSLVIRYSGGQQAGHTVYFNDVKHVFSNFGSGSLRGVPTYWSKFCSFNPISLLNEYDVLKTKGFTPKLYIDRDCPVTTPYETNANRLDLMSKADGTCGMGVGNTFKREENHYSLKASDLKNKTILDIKIKLLDEYYSWFNLETEFNVFKNCVRELINNKDIEIVSGDIISNGNYIFEGSQGLLLDQNYGFFPHVTRSSVGSKNINHFVGNSDVEYYLVTRAYQTRHGNGPMTNENIEHNILRNPEETNITNDFQGKFRISLLDLDLLEYTLECDENIRKNINKNLVITCLDHVKNDGYRLTHKKKILTFNKENFIHKIKDTLNIKNVYISESPYSKNLKKIK